MGALTQAPRHSTSDRVNILSLVVSPTPTPRACLQAVRISSEPRSQHGVVVQICKLNLNYVNTVFMLRTIKFVMPIEILAARDL